MSLRKVTESRARQLSLLEIIIAYAATVTLTVMLGAVLTAAAVRDPLADAPVAATGATLGAVMLLAVALCHGLAVAKVEQLRAREPE